MISNGRLFQQAYLVTDLVQSCRHWADLFGAGPFVIVPHHRTDTFAYRGTDQEADVSYAFGYLGDMMIQFIEQHDDPPHILEAFSRWRRAHANWKPGDDPIANQEK